MITGFTCSCWDLLHAGHIMFLNEAKEYCDYLIVGVQSDPTIDRPSKNKPIESLEERLIKIAALRQVDAFFSYDTEEDLYEYLKSHKNTIDIRFLGSDYRDKHFTGDDLNIEIHYHERDHDYSSSNIRQRIVTQDADAKYDVVRDVIVGMQARQFKTRGYL